MSRCELISLDILLRLIWSVTESQQRGLECSECRCSTGHWGTCKICAHLERMGRDSEKTLKKMACGQLNLIPVLPSFCSLSVTAAWGQAPAVVVSLETWEGGWGCLAHLGTVPNASPRPRQRVNHVPTVSQALHLMGPCCHGDIPAGRVLRHVIGDLPITPAVLVNVTWATRWRPHVFVFFTPSPWWIAQLIRDRWSASFPHFGLICLMEYI